MTTKKAQVVMLPTDKEAHIGKCIKELRDVKIGQLVYAPPMMMSLEYFQTQHLYFTTNDEIKDDDWVIGKYSNYLTLDQISKMNNLGNNSILLKSGYDVTPTTLQKIVATTNKELFFQPTEMQTWTGPDKIPTDFIEAYVREQGRIKEVLLEYEIYDIRRANDGIEHSAFEPEWMKPPVLDGKMRLKLRPNGTVIIHPVKTGKLSLMYTDPVQLQQSLEVLIRYNWDDEMRNFQETFEMEIQSQDDLGKWIKWAEDASKGCSTGPKEHIFYHLMVLKSSIPTE